MKNYSNATDLTESVMNQIKAVPQQHDYRAALSTEAIKHVNDIFRALQGAFPAWRSAFPDDASLKAAKATWVKALIDNGMTDFDLIAKGVRKARQSENPFFPSIGQFISWCKPTADELGLPDSQSAWLELNNNSHQVLNHQWTHPAIYEAGRRLGWFEVRNGTATQKQFDQVYTAIIAELSRGAGFDMPKPDATKLERQAGDKTTTEEAKAAAAAALAAMKKGL